MVAARLATILTGGAVVALTFVMQYAQGADDLFNLSNKVFGVFLPPIAIPMLAGIFVRRLSKRSGMVALVGGIAVGLVVFVIGGVKEYSYLREMVWVFPITAASTVALLVAGTKIFPDKDDERAEVDEFFDQIEGKA
jgi:Na+/proline symporter